MEDVADAELTAPPQSIDELSDVVDAFQKAASCDDADAVATQETHVPFSERDMETCLMVTTHA